LDSMTTQEITQKVLSIAKELDAEFCEVVVAQNQTSLKRIKQNQVDQAPSSEQWEIDLALVKNNRRKTVRFDNPIFAESMVKDAMRNITLQPVQDIYIPKNRFAHVKQSKLLYDEKTAHLDDSHLITIAKKMNQELDRNGLYFSGKIAQGRGEITYANSVGTEQTMRFTLATTAAFAFDRTDPSISAYSSSGGISVDNIDIPHLIRELSAKCALMRGKKKVDLFDGKPEGEDLKIDVIVEPYFFEPIFEWLGFFGFNGLLVERGESFISNKLDQQVTGSQISIKDDPHDKRNQGMGFLFDFEGRPRKAKTLIEKGIAKSAVYDSALAKKWDREATGNALPPTRRSEGAAPFNLVIEGGQTTIEDMIAQSKKPTLWITKLHYLGMKHYQTATMTGVAQHGVFLIENGKVQSPVENLRFEESIPESLKRVEAMSPSRLIFQPVSLTAPAGLVAPAMKIRDFRFVGSTKRTL